MSYDNLSSVSQNGSLSFLVGTISNVLVMEIGWTDVGSGGNILVSCAHSNTSLNLHHGRVMSKYIICQSFKKFHRAVFSIAHPKYSNFGGILDAR
jgi:hypothetical protein